MNPQAITQQTKAYFDAWRGVRKDTLLSRGDLAIMDTIQDQLYTDIWFSYQTFADRVGMQRNGVISSIKRLTALGYLEKVPGKKKTSTNHYILSEKLRNPYKDYSQVEMLLARFYDAKTCIPQTSSAKKVVSAKILTSIPEDTSASILGDTLTYQDNVPNQRERNEGILSDFLENNLLKGKDRTAKDGFDKVDTIVVNETISTGFGELDDMELWNVAKKYTVMVEIVETKYKDVLSAVERKQTYGTKSTLQLLELFISKDIEKGYIPQPNEITIMLIDSYHPTKVIETHEAFKLVNYLHRDIQTAPIEKYFEKGHLPYACDAVIDYYLESKKVSYYGSEKSKKTFIDWKVKNRNKAANKIAKVFKQGISIQQFKDYISNNPNLDLSQVIANLTQHTTQTN